MKWLPLLFILLLAVTSSLFAQRNINGKVIDENDKPLYNATILVPGSSGGVLSDAEGNFSLNLPTEAEKIVVSYVGYATQEVVIGPENNLVVVLTQGVQLEEMLVVALGIPRAEKSLGYAVSHLEGDELSEVPVTNIVNSLEGRAAGVNVIGSSGNIGSSSRIIIRGVNSIFGENQPLFVIDGVPIDNSNFNSYWWQEWGGPGYDYGNAAQDINTNDIESVNVLKGQAAAALYGSRGANGVIMITTKKGKKSLSRGIGVSFSTSLLFENVAVLPDYQNRYGGGVDLLPHGFSDNSGYYKMPLVEFGPQGDTAGVYQSFDLVPIYAVDESWGVRFQTNSDEHFSHLDGLGFGDGTDRYNFPNGYGSNQDHLMFRDWNSWDEWDKEHYSVARRWEAGKGNPRDFYKTGTTWATNIAFDGGTEKSTFRLSYNRINQKGIYPNSELIRNNLGFNGSLGLGKNIQTFLGINYINSKTIGRSASGYDLSSTNPSQAFNQWWHTQLNIEDLKSYKNPDGSMRTWNRQSAFNPTPQYWDNPYWARYENYQENARNRLFGNVGLTYNINNWLSATGRVMTDFYTDRREERIAVGSQNIPNYTQDVYQVSETNTDLMLKADRALNSNFSLHTFVGINKQWRTIMRDFGSTVGGLNVPGLYNLQNSIDRPVVINEVFEKEIESVFGGINLGYKGYLYLDLTGRNDWSSTLPKDNNSYFYPSASLSFIFTELWSPKFLSFGKARLGWAIVGNDTEPYNVFNVYTPNNNFGNIPNYTVSDILNNQHLKPEQTSSIETGLDLRFFTDRLRLDLTFYTAKTTDQIIPLSTTAATGFTSQFINAGEISNKGIEIELGGTAFQTKGFSWDLQLIFGKNINKLVELKADDPSLTSLPIADIWGATLSAYEGEPYGTILGTDYLRDINGDRLVDPYTGFYLHTTDLVPIGNITPDFTGGFINTFLYKGFALNVFIDFRKGGDIFSTTNMFGKWSGILKETAEGDIRENGVVVDGVLAVTDENGQPIMEYEGDPNVLGDEVYASDEQNTTSIPAQAHYVVNGGFFITAADVYDGSFIKLREIGLSYTLPQNWIHRMKVQDFTISMVSRNIAILYKNIPNLDPDNAISSGNIQGLEGGQVPGTRSIGFSINFRF